ncbi:hypothetical protein V5O48_001570 [Marasmius crinis-equi]|uniref:DUF6533 domain-containing protein n=1 Tax=Marasmius crinis-equi TaxID=585013 RepID=A0ABR3FXZ3_9AGAR
MSGVVDANWAAAASLGMDEATTTSLATALGLIHVLQVYTSCMVALATWDWLVCLKLEWAHIWRREWSLVKFLYIWTRYYGLLAFGLNLWLFNDNFTVEQCKKLHYLIAATCMWVTLGSEAILAVRTYAFLGKGKFIGAALLVMLLAETGFLLFVSIGAVHQTPQVFPRGPCTASDAPGKHIVSGFWLAPVAFDLICTFLTLYKAVRLQTVGVKNPIVAIFVREGLGYFLVLCCRLVLNLRASRDAGNPGGNFSSNSAGHPVFHSTPPIRGTQTGTINIPLDRIGNQEHYTNDDEYGGVKVQTLIMTG